MNIKRYKVGMYGGKFMPLHKGHLHCLQVAAKECEKVYFILFYGGQQEEEIHQEHSKETYLHLQARLAQMHKAVKNYNLDNVVVRLINITNCRNPDGSEDWDAETPLVLQCCGHLDAVYASEQAYGDYFTRAYPDAVFRCIDSDRKVINISATEIRDMSPEERKKWMV